MFNTTVCFGLVGMDLDHNRGVVPGFAGFAMTHPDFARSVNPISPSGTYYAHLITTGTPEFSDHPTALHNITQNIY